MSKIIELEKYMHGAIEKIEALKREIEQLKLQEEKKAIKIEGEYYIGVSWGGTNKNPNDHKTSDLNSFETVHEAEKFRAYLCVLRKIAAICKNKKLAHWKIIEFLYYGEVNLSDREIIDRELSDNDREILRDGLI